MCVSNALSCSPDRKLMSSFMRAASVLNSGSWIIEHCSECGMKRYRAVRCDAWRQGEWASPELVVQNQVHDLFIGIVLGVVADERQARKIGARFGCNHCEIANLTGIVHRLDRVAVTCPALADTALYL